MQTHYNRIAGQSVERLAALSDGVFAVAMTLLVLDLRAPATEATHSERDLLHALAPLASRLLVFLLSFMTLGIFWVGQQVQLSYLARSTRDLTWTHLAILVSISLMPFSTALMAAFIHFRVALLVYWLNVIAHPQRADHPDRMTGTPSSAARRASSAVSPCKRPVAITLAAAA
jgi:uncharacterized membrane protein